VSSSQPEDRILTEAQLSDTLYRTYKLALKGADPIALVQAKGNFQVKMLELKQRPLTAAALDSVFYKVARNYRSLIPLNEDKIKDQKELEAKKQSYKDLIEQLTKSNARLDQTITIISSQPPPQPALPK
jgi:arsenate reductase-like glutaredoxin family protein